MACGAAYFGAVIRAGYHCLINSLHDQRCFSVDATDFLNFQIQLLKQYTPTKVYCLFGVNQLFVPVSAVLPHKLAQTRHPTVQRYNNNVILYTPACPYIFFSRFFEQNSCDKVQLFTVLLASTNKLTGNKTGRIQFASFFQRSIPKIFHAMLCKQKRCVKKLRR